MYPQYIIHFFRETLFYLWYRKWDKISIIFLEDCRLKAADHKTMNQLEIYKESLCEDFKDVSLFIILIWKTRLKNVYYQFNQIVAWTSEGLNINKNQGLSPSMAFCWKNRYIVFLSGF